MEDDALQIDSPEQEPVDDFGDSDFEELHLPSTPSPAVERANPFDASSSPTRTAKSTLSPQQSLKKRRRLRRPKEKPRSEQLDYQESLPYATEFIEDMDAKLEEIVRRLVDCVRAKDYDVGFVQWNHRLECWISLKYPMKRELRAKLARLYFELSVLPGMDARLVDIAVNQAIALLEPKKKIDISDLQLPWRPIYAILEKELFPKQRKTGITNLATTLLSLVEYSQRFFPSHKELCYLEFLLETEATAVQFAKDQVIKDTDGRNVFLNDGFKSDSTGREVYYVSYCYASSSVKGSTSESKMGDSTTLSNPFADIIDGLGIQSNVGFGGRGGLLASLVGGSGGGTASGLLRKRQLFNGLGGLGGSSFGSSSPLDDNSFGSSLGGSPIGNSLSSPLSSSPLDALNGDSPTDNFDATKAIQGIGGSSDTLAGQSGLLGGDGGENAPAGRNYGDLGEGRGSGLFDDDARATTSSARENKPTGFHIRQSSVVESVLHSDSRNTNTRPSRLASATTRAAAPSSAASSVATNRPSSSSFVPVQLAQPGGPTIAVAIVSQPSPTATGTMGSPEQQYSIQTIQATAVH